MLAVCWNCRKSVSDVMVHRTKMRLIDADLPPGVGARSDRLALHPAPLAREPDNIIGVLHAKDCSGRMSQLATPLAERPLI
jgi:Mg2+/Co2+ transporter CorB